MTDQSLAEAEKLIKESLKRGFELKYEMRGDGKEIVTTFNSDMARAISEALSAREAAVWKAVVGIVINWRNDLKHEKGGAHCYDGCDACIRFNVEAMAWMEIRSALVTLAASRGFKVE